MQAYLIKVWEIEMDIDNLIEQFQDIAEEDEEMLRVGLAEMGYDYDEIMEEGVKFIRKLRKATSNAITNKHNIGFPDIIEE